MKKLGSRKKSYVHTTEVLVLNLGPVFTAQWSRIFPWSLDMGNCSYRHFLFYTDQYALLRRGYWKHRDHSESNFSC